MSALQTWTAPVPRDNTTVALLNFVPLRTIICGESTQDRSLCDFWVFLPPNSDPSGSIFSKPTVCSRHLVSSTSLEHLSAARCHLEAYLQDRSLCDFWVFFPQNSDPSGPIFSKPTVCARYLVSSTSLEHLSAAPCHLEACLQGYHKEGEPNTEKLHPVGFPISENLPFKTGPSPARDHFDAGLQRPSRWRGAACSCAICWG
jgi:hypothetical protein